MQAGTIVRGLVFWIGLTILLSVRPLRGQETEVLNNDKVVEMVRARLGVEVIVEQIRSNPGHYTLNTSSLIKLRQQGVPDKVIAAMQAKRSGGVAAGRKTRAGLRKQRLLRQVEARGAEHRVFGSWMMFRIECQAGHTLRRLSVSERAPRRRG